MARQGLLLQQSDAIMFTIGILFGLYIITACFANRWLLFSDEGWKLKKRIHWLMVIMTNVLVVLIFVDTTFSVQIAMAQSAFVESGHTSEEWIDVPWHAIVNVGFKNHWTKT